MKTLTLREAPQAAVPRDAAAVRVRRIGIHTYQEPVVYMHTDCAVCRSEGFEAESRVRLTCAGRSIEATLNVVTSNLLSTDEAGLSESAWLLLGAKEGAWVRLSHPEPMDSLAHVRAKLYGATLDERALRAVVRDIAAQRYTAIEVAAFVAACAGGRMNRGEVLGLTRAMVDVGERLAWQRTPVVDKHCVGGLPGNRTTPIVVAIVAACGLLIPKTSSRAITSPAGTADAMEALAPVDLDIEQMRAVVEREGGCVVWGGAVRLSPADDVLIRVERPLDLDSEAQLVASVLSKKVAAGRARRGNAGERTGLEAICEAQGGMREPPLAAHSRAVLAHASGRVAGIDNRRLARAAKLAGAPAAPVAGALMHARVGEAVERGQPLFTMHAASLGELAYAGRYVDGGPPIVHVREDA